MLASLAALIGLPGCGDDDKADAGGAALAWEGAPVVRASSTRAHVLIGKVKNTSDAALRITVRQVKVVDARGRRIPSTAIFTSSYVRSIYPHNAISQADPREYPQAEQKRVGYLAVLESGDETPITLSWRERPEGRRAAQVVVGTASLPLPRAVSEVP